MIPRDTALQVQAYVDGELPSAEAQRLASLMDRNAELRTLCEELARVKALLKDHEPAFSVPESREFHWSKIVREIQRSLPPESPPTPSRTGWWLRFGVPLGSTALLAGMLLLRSTSGDNGSLYLATGHEIETPLTEMDSITFRSEAARMTVVWVDESLN